MGINSSAHIYYGIPVFAFDEGEATAFWDDDADDWKTFEHFVIEPFGHYEDDEPKGILTLKGLDDLSAEAWGATALPVRYMDMDADSHYQPLFWGAAAKDGLTEEIEAIDASLGWWLVASVG